MKCAEDLLREYTESLTAGGVDKTIELFAEDADFELPYLVSLGIQSHYHGREEIKEFFDAELYPDWKFDPAETKILISTPDQVFAEFISRPTAAATGRPIEHLFMARLVAENGQIKLMREALNTVAAAQALLPGGPADIVIPRGTIRSF